MRRRTKKTIITTTIAIVMGLTSVAPALAQDDPDNGVVLVQDQETGPELDDAPAGEEEEIVEDSSSEPETAQEEVLEEVLKDEPAETEKIKTAAVSESEEESEAEAEKIPIKGFTVEGVRDECLWEDKVYLNVKLKDKSGNKLVRDEDFEVEYVDNDKIGTARVIISGIGNYTGTIEKTFDIKYSACALEVSDIKPQEYTSKMIKPVPEVWFKGKKLKEGKDYTITYSNVISVGDKACVNINGLGIYSGFPGTQSKYFSIIPAQKNEIKASDMTVNFSQGSQILFLNAWGTDVSAKMSYETDSSEVTVDKSGMVKIPAKFMGKFKVTVTAAPTKNCVGATKTITINVPYKYQSSGKVYKSYESAAKEIQKNLSKRKKSFTINLELKTSDKDPGKTLTRLYQYVRCTDNESLRGGQNAFSQIPSLYRVAKNTAIVNGKLYGTIEYRETYRTTYKQDTKLLKAIDKKVKDIGANKGSQSARLKKIYKWITRYVKYSYGSVSEKNKTAYGAFYNKKANCSGYANLMRLMCLSAGIKCHVVGNDTHVWCIVEKGGKWYQCDPCWDAGSSAANWKYYMKKYNSKWKKESNHVLYSGFIKYNDDVKLAK